MSFVFSFVMTVIAHSRRADIFAATTAFAGSPSCVRNWLQRHVIVERDVLKTLQLDLEVSNFRASLESYRRNDETQSHQYQLEARL